MFHRKHFTIQGGAGCLLGIVSLAALGCRDRDAPEDTWVPVVAKVRQTVTEHPATGASVEKGVWEGSYLRDLRGSELRKREQVFPRPAQPKLEGTFVDRSRPQWKAYRLGFPKYSPIMSSSEAPARPDPATSREQLISAGRQEDTVEGIRCFVVPFETRASDAVSLGGRGCYSPEYELHLYQELDSTVHESGLTVRTRRELYDIQLGVAPAADQMCLPPDLIVQDSKYQTCPDKP